MKEIPEILIEYNRFLDPIFTFYCQNNPELKGKGWNDWTPPTKEEIERRVDAYRSEWAKDGERILKALVDITGLPFNRNVIDVHIVSGNPREFSHPIVMKSGFEPSEFIDRLTHELIHRLFVVNRLKKSVIVPNECVTETDLVKNHILVHSLLKYVYLDVLKDPKKLEVNIESSARHSTNDYSRAWRIVEEVGYKKLIEEFKRKTSPGEMAQERLAD